MAMHIAMMCIINVNPLYPNSSAAAPVSSVLCYVMLCYVMLCYVMLCYVMLCYVMLCYVMLCYVMLCYVIYLSIHPSIHLSIGDVLAVAASAVRGWKGVLRFFSMDVRCPPICRQTCLASAR